VHVHFVCAGNVYRSRLAEALLNSHELPGVRASSSGIRAAENRNGPVSWTALRLLKRHGLIPFMSSHWTQTTPELLAAADLVVFLEPAIHATCVTAFAFAGGACEVWDVPDVADPRFPEQQAEPGDETRLIAITEATFARLQREIAALAERLRPRNAGASASDAAVAAREAAS
jgi:protein-tyrosine-phosphatase